MTSFSNGYILGTNIIQEMFPLSDTETSNGNSSESTSHHDIHSDMDTSFHLTDSSGSNTDSNPEIDTDWDMEIGELSAEALEADQQQEEDLDQDTESDGAETEVEAGNESYILALATGDSENATARKLSPTLMAL